MRLAGLCVVGLLAVACQSCGSVPQPALLMQGDNAAMGRLKAALETELGRRPVDLGPSDPTHSSVISVLPVPAGPLNDRDMAFPTTFRLESDGRTCALVREDTGRRVALDGVACRVP